MLVCWVCGSFKLNFNFHRGLNSSFIPIRRLSTNIYVMLAIFLKYFDSSSHWIWRHHKYFANYGHDSEFKAAYQQRPPITVKSLLISLLIYEWVEFLPNTRKPFIKHFRPWNIEYFRLFWQFRFSEAPKTHHMSMPASRSSPQNLTSLD